MELVPNEKYHLTWRDDLDTTLLVEFIRFERGFYVFRGLDGEQIVARANSIIVSLYNKSD